ncbi:protein phosphatase 2C domain-containing protein [Streptomyces gardneri]|uniref:protein phosphatase 2C domain-containing protein n=1 Tax=Streptomyces gardneri TaxID=66892 RepID=UPI0036B724C5
MTQQGDNWWDKLYDESAPDTAPTVPGESLDDHFATATRATTGPPGPSPDLKPTADPGAAADLVAAADPGAEVDLAEADPAPVEQPAPDPRAVLSDRAPWETPEHGPRSFPGPPPPAPVAPPAETPTVQVQLPVPEPQADDDADADPEYSPESTPETRPDADLTVQVPVPRPRAAGFVGSRPPTYEPEPTALPVARPGELAELVSDTVLDGARYGTCTLRAASVRGDSARYRGEPRRDALLTARFGHDEAALVLVAVAAGSRAAEDAHLAAADACQWIAEAVGRSHARLSEDIRTGRRGDLKSGLHRLTDRTYGKLRARAADRGLAPDEYTATLRCLLVPADPECRTRVFFGIGGGGLFRLREGSWQDIEPLLPEPAAVTGAPVVGFGSPPSPKDADETEEGDRLTMNLGVTTPPGPLVEEPVPPPAEPFRFRASVARPGDTLLLASPGLAEPMRGEPALARELATRWAGQEAPGLAAFLADTQLRVTGYADDRTGVAVWEA